MKRLIIALLLLSACDDSLKPEERFTGNETVYNLEAGSEYVISGMVLVQEMTDGKPYVTITLEGTENGLQHPVHLHLGDLSLPDAEIAALLNPINGKTGKSETLLNTLANESTISYDQLLDLNASIKIHLAESGVGRDIILAGTNIGTATTSSPSGRFGIVICQ